MMISLAYLTTMSEYGLVLIRVAFQMREYIEQANAADEKDREKAAELLKKMADCLGGIEVELRADKPNLGRYVGAMREYLIAFSSVFVPLLGEAKTKEVLANMQGLFVGGDSEFGPMIGGFLTLKKCTEEGSVSETHTSASIATITLAEGQLSALAELIEFSEVFRDKNNDRIGESHV